MPNKAKVFQLAKRLKLQIHAKQKYAPARGASPYMRESGDIVEYFNKLSGFQLSVNTRTCLAGLAQRTIRILS